MPNQEEPTKDQPNISVTSINQQGGITTGILNVNVDPAPQVTLTDLGCTKTNDRYINQAMLTITTRYPVPEVCVIARAESILNLEVVPQRTGISMSGHSGKREGWHFTTLLNVYGTYKIIAETSQLEKVSIELQQP